MLSRIKIKYIELAAIRREMIGSNFSDTNNQGVWMRPDSVVTETQTLPRSVEGSYFCEAVFEWDFFESYANLCMISIYSIFE